MMMTEDAPLEILQLLNT